MKVTVRPMRAGVASRPSFGAAASGRGSVQLRSVRSWRVSVAKVAVAAPSAANGTAPAPAPETAAPAARVQLSEKHRQLLQTHKGPLVKIATHYHVGFGDCLRVIGSSEELGAWKAEGAPLMKWGEGDVWTLVTPLPPGEHAFKIVVQQRSGNLVWEAGDANRVVSVPEGAPVDAMITSVCAFNIIDTTAESKLQPVSADVLALLDAQLEEAAAEEEARLAAAAEQAAAEAEKSRVVQAAAAVANAFATMDAEAEESGIRPRTLSDSDEDDEEPGASTPSRSRSGPPVVAAAMTQAAPAPATAQHDTAAGQAPVGRFEAAGLKAKGLPVDSATTAAQDTVAAAVGRFEAAGLRSKQQPDSAAQPETAATAEPEQAQQQEVVAHAAQEMEANLEFMSKEVPDVPASSSATAAAVHAKFAQGKPPAVGFVDKPAAPPGERVYTNSVVAAFMKSVGSRGVSPAPAAPAAEPAPAAATAAAAEPAAASATTEPAAAATVAKAVTAADAPAAAAAKAATDAPAAAAPAAAADKPAADASTAAALPKGWGPSAGASLFPARPAVADSSSETVSSASLSSIATSGPDSRGFSSSLATASAGTPPNSPSRNQRPPSPGRGSSHIVSAAAAAAVAAEWIENVRSNNVVTAAREAEKAASELAARLQTAREKKSQAAAEAERLHESLKHSSMVKGVTPAAAAAAAPSSGTGGGGAAAAAVPTPANTGFMAAARSKVRDMTESVAAASAASSNPLSPPPITPLGGSPALAAAAASSAMAASAAAGVGPSPPPVVSTPVGSSQRSVSTSAVSVSGGNSGGAGALTASGAFSDASAEAGAVETAEGGPAGGKLSDGMLFLAAVVGCAAVGTVMWSEFVLKDTGCGLPPGPFGLLGAAEGLSYLTVLGLAGAGVGARVNSGGKQGLQGVLAVPETLAYGALAAGLMVMASQLATYGYIPGPLPGGECFADGAVGSEALTDQLAALQAVIWQGMSKLHLQDQLTILQTQVEYFSDYVAAQAEVADAALQLGLFQLQDSLLNATDAVSAFVDTQLQQLDVSGKLSGVLDILRAQEQQLKVELPRQLAELQQLAATSMAVVQETALQASSTAHLPELLSSLDSVMAMLHGVLESRIAQLDSVLTHLQGSIGAAAGQLSAAVAAAEASGSKEAAAQLQGLQAALSDAMADVQAQVWAGYQQLELADKLGDMLLTVRTSAAAVASSTAAEVDKLQLREQLQQLEGLAEASSAALAANAVDSIQRLHLDERLHGIASQASAAAASLQAGLQHQYETTGPALAAQMTSLQKSLTELSSKAGSQLNGSGPELETLLRQLGDSMQSTVKLVGEVASTGVTAAGHAVQGAGQSASSGLAAVNEQLGAATDAVSSSLVTSFPQAVAPTVTAPVLTQTSSAVTDVAAPVTAVSSASSAVVDAVAPVMVTVRDSAVDAASAVTQAASARTDAAAAAVAQAAAARADAAAAVAQAAAASADATAAAVRPAVTEFLVDPVVRPAVGGFAVHPDTVTAAYAEAVEAGLDYSQLVAYALPDAAETLQKLPHAQSYSVAPGVNLTDASDVMKSIWWNRPQ